MTERSEIQWGLTVIAFAVHRSDRRKTVALTVDDGKLVVTAPTGVPLGRLNDVVRRKAAWVVARLRRAAELPTPPSTREFVTGETVHYRGRQLRLRVIETTDEATARMWAGWYEVPITTGLRGDVRGREVRRGLARSLKGHAEVCLPEMLRVVCERLSLRAPEMRVREQRKRWGSCDAEGMLRINWRIIQAPQTLIDYVLVHELVHVEHRAHGPEFWAALARWMPDYEARRRRLREMGPLMAW